MKTKTKANLIFIAILVVGLIFVGAIQSDSNEILWNNGICPKDGTSWEYNNSAHGRYWRYDYYTCDNGHVIELVNDYGTR